MQFILAGLLSLITLANAAFQYGCGQSDLWNQNKLACYNSFPGTAKSYRNSGCALLSICLGNSTFTTLSERFKCFGGNDGDLSAAQALIRSHFYVTNRCLVAGLNFSTCAHYGASFATANATVTAISSAADNSTVPIMERSLQFRSFCALNASRRECKVAAAADQ